MSFNDFKIPRKSGILRKLRADNPGMPVTDAQIEKAIQYEYLNYTEGCDMCCEEPLLIEEWSNQTIKPKQ